MSIPNPCMESFHQSPDLLNAGTTTGGKWETRWRENLTPRCRFPEDLTPSATRSAAQPGIRPDRPSRTPRLFHARTLASAGDYAAASAARLHEQHAKAGSESSYWWSWAKGAACLMFRKVQQVEQGPVCRPLQAFFPSPRGLDAALQDLIDTGRARKVNEWSPPLVSTAPLELLPAPWAPHQTGGILSLDSLPHWFD